MSVDFAQVIRERQTHLGLSLPRLFRKELEATKPRRRREGIEKEREREKRGREEEEENILKEPPSGQTVSQCDTDHRAIAYNLLQLAHILLLIQHFLTNRAV